MLSADPIGGLGNQMFIIAATYTHAQQHGYQIRFIIPFYPSLLHKQFLWRLLPFNFFRSAPAHISPSPSEPVISLPTVKTTLGLKKSVLYEILRIARICERRVIKWFIDMKMYSVPTFISKMSKKNLSGGKMILDYFHFYNPKEIVIAGLSMQQKKVFRVVNSWEYIPLPVQDKIHFEGYFQNLRYFSHNRKNVENLFLFNHTRAWQFLTDHNLDPKNIVTIHVRRGDYIDKHLYADPTSKEYIEEALSHFPGKRPLFVAQDRQWVREHFPGELCSYLPYDLDDMSLMILAHNHIIWASSFSWWGAWLANKNQVVGPRHWDRVDNTDVVSALYPPGWTVLEY